VRTESTRRKFLSAAGLTGLTGLGLAPSTAVASTPSGASEVVEFFGKHQAGIATRTQEHLQFVALDVDSDAASDLRWLLRNLSLAAARLSRGQPVGSLQTGSAPPVDTGEAVGCKPSRLTVTIGLGPAIFHPRRFGLAERRPRPLAPLPAFPNDALRSRLSGGDIGVQVCAEDPQVTFHAVHNLIRLASPIATPRWLLAGFGRTANSRRQATPRNLMGFKDGTNNIMVEDTHQLDEFVWAAAPESPAWMHGGSYMVVRRIAMELGRWDGTGLDQQEQTFGRHKISGAPLGAVHEHDPLDLAARRHGHPVIPEDAHIRLASASYNDGERILRRGYSYTDGIDPGQGSPAAGLLFICYQRDPHRQFVPIQRRLASKDALNQHIVHVGSAMFACPPGAPAGGFVGEGLFV
jgi:deferrochelatase/peroxidase EfeB